MKTKLLFITSLLIATCFQLNAQTITWDGGASTTTWSDAANWTGDVVPGTGDDVDLNGATVVLTGNTQVQRIYAGGSSNFTINSGVTLTVTGFAGGDDGLEIQGSATVTNNGTINISNITGAAADGLYVKGAFTNASTGTVAIDGTGEYNIYIQGGTFTNEGNITLTNFGNSNSDRDGIAVDDNSGTPGTFHNNAGSITITMTGGDDGIYVNDGSTFNNTALITIGGLAGDNGMRVDDAGTFNNNLGATLTINATPDDQILLDSTGLFNNLGTVSLSNSVDVGFFVTDESVFTNGATGVLNISGAGDNSLYIDGNTTSSSPYLTPNPIVNNSGTITITGNATFDGLRLNDDATLNNNSGGTITLNNSGDEGIQIDPGCTITNSGTIDIITPVDHGMECFGTFNNLNGGVFKATNCPDDGIRLQNDGVFNNDGAVNIDGSGGEDIETETVASWVNTANATFNPGSSPGDIEIRDDFDLGAATVTFEINGTTAVTEYDQIIASTSSNTFTVGSSTKINLVWGFTPSIGDKFDVIDASGTLSGSIDIANVTSTHKVTVTVVGNDLEVEVTNISSTWTGNNGNTWNDALNWSDGIPISTTNVTIPSGLTNYPTASGAVTTNGITMASGASFIANSSVTGDITYNLSIPDTNWHLVSSPVNGETYDDAWVTANSIASGSVSSSNRGIAEYQNGTPDGTTGPWTYMQGGAAAETFDSGTGYSMKATGATTYGFTGTYPTLPNQPAITQDVNNWNLVGNPAPAYIDVAAYITANTANLGGAFQALYVYSSGTGYTGLTSGYIHPGQAFFVSSNVASGSLSTTSAMLSHQTGVTFHKENKKSIELSISDGNSSQKTSITYENKGSLGLDIGKDIGKFNGVNIPLSIYTNLLENNENIAFEKQVLPDADYNNMIVPVGVIAESGKEITFSAISLNLPEGINVMLEDRMNNIFTNLNQENYKITLSEALNGNGRFFLHTSSKSALSVVDNVGLDNIVIYKSNATTLRISGLQQGTTNVKMFNILGKQVMTTSFDVSGIKDISLPRLTSGVYIVQLETEKGNLNKKIILE